MEGKEGQGGAAYMYDIPPTRRWRGFNGDSTTRSAVLRSGGPGKGHIPRAGALLEVGCKVRGGGQGAGRRHPQPVPRRRRRREILFPKGIKSADQMI